MKDIIPNINSGMNSGLHGTAHVVDLSEEKKLEREAEALVELHDFIKAHPDTPVKEIAKFMPPVDSRVVSKAIKMLAIRDKSMTPEQKANVAEKAKSIEVEPRVVKWGK